MRQMTVSFLKISQKFINAEHEDSKLPCWLHVSLFMFALSLISLPMPRAAMPCEMRRAAIKSPAEKKRSGAFKSEKPFRDFFFNVNKM